MKNKVWVLSFFLCSQALFAGLPLNYQTLDAANKQHLLWQEIESSPWKTLPELNNSGWSSLLKSLGALFSLAKTFDHVSDEVPEGRTKFIHTYGSVVQFKFTPEKKQPFTGFYQEECVGIARLSLAANPKKLSYTPGMALKFLVDEKPSLNLVVMNMLDGQGDNWNFFAKAFSNKVPGAKSRTLKFLEWIFSLTRKDPGNLPVDHLAQMTSFGKEVENPVVPEQLYFYPAPEVSKIISPDSREDFRKHLEAIPAGTSLYNVIGILGGKAVKIGVMKTASKFVSSKYGDKKLFFQHRR